MKNVIITGANGNLGLAVTNYFLNNGYRVIATVIKESMIADFTPADSLDVQVVDLSNEKSAGDFINYSIGKYKVIHAALMLAGGFAMGKIRDTGSGELRKQMALNFETAYNIARPVYEHMIAQQNGRLVFIGARPALQAAQGKDMIAYGLSKSLLFKLAEYINEDAKGKNVTATVIVPSTIDTPANRQSMPEADPENWVKPEDLAGILEFIVSGKSAALRESVVKVYNNS